jgi:hypothetical protein
MVLRTKSNCLHMRDYCRESVWAVRAATPPMILIDLTLIVHLDKKRKSRRTFLPRRGMASQVHLCKSLSLMVSRLFDLGV